MAEAGVGVGNDMRVRVLQLGRRVVQYSGPAGVTLDVVLESVGMAGLQGMDLRVNGSAGGGDQVVKDGDVVTLIPRIKGGAPVLHA